MSKFDFRTEPKPITSKQPLHFLATMAGKEAVLNLRIFIQATGLTKTMRFSGDMSVHECCKDIKEKAAAFIDKCNDLRGLTEDGEMKRMYSVAITEAQTAQMWAVKAVTWGSK